MTQFILCIRIRSQTELISHLSLRILMIRGLYYKLHPLFKYTFIIAHISITSLLIAINHLSASAQYILLRVQCPLPIEYHLSSHASPQVIFLSDKDNEVRATTNYSDAGIILFSVNFMSFCISQLLHLQAKRLTQTKSQVL